MFAGCFIVRSWRLASGLTGSKSLVSSKPISISAWQLPRQFNIVFRFGWKDRALVVTWVGCLIGQGSGILVSGWSPLAAKSVHTLWFASENQLEIAVLSQVNHVFVVKHNKQFKRDSQRLAFLLLLQV